MEINLKSREVSVKVVYYGPGLSGKTTNLEIIHEKTPQPTKGKLSSLATDQDRTLFFDYMPLELGEISGLKIRLRLFTVPGQVYYNSTRQLVLRCVDGIVFVADSQSNMNEQNIQSFQNLHQNLRELDIDIEDVPIVMQYNKRDLPNIMPVEYMTQTLNRELNAPFFETVAVRGDGVFQTLKCIANKTLKKAEENIKNNSRRKVVNSKSLEETKTRKMETTPSSIKIPSNTKFQLSFNKKNKEESEQQPSLENTSKLPFKINRKETSNRLEIPIGKNSEQTSTEKVNLRKSNDNSVKTEDKNLSAEKTMTGSATDTFKKTSTGLFKGSLSQSNHINVNSKPVVQAPSNEGLKDRLKNIEKFKNIFEDQN